MSASPAAAAAPGPLLVAGWPRSGPLGAGLGVAVLLVSLAGGALAVHLEHHYATMAATGDDLGPVASQVAAGSGPRTAWVGFAAALLFGLSTLRVIRGVPEPPMGVDATASVAAIRQALRRELDLVRRALAVVGLVACLDLGRAAVTVTVAVRSPGVARDTAGWTLVEAAGLLAAAALLAAWCTAFRALCRSLGAS